MAKSQRHEQSARTPKPLFWLHGDVKTPLHA